MNGPTIALALLLAASPGEGVNQMKAAGFVTGFEQEKGPGYIREAVPRGESVHDWSRMITTQRFRGVVTQGTDARVFAGNFSGLWRGSCPGGRVSPPTPLRIANTRGAIELRADCPRNPQTGKPETMFMRAITGGGDLHVVQVAFRRVATAQDAAFARAHLSSVSLCNSGPRTPRCVP